MTDIMVIYVYISRSNKLCHSMGTLTWIFKLGKKIYENDTIIF